MVARRSNSVPPYSDHSRYSGHSRINPIDLNQFDMVARLEGYPPIGLGLGIYHYYMTSAAGGRLSLIAIACSSRQGSWLLIDR